MQNKTPDVVRKIRVLRGNETLEAQLMGWEEDSAHPGVSLLMLEVDKAVYRATSSKGYFKAFQLIREQLEPKGMMAYCFASSRNVYPSPMAESVGATEIAYKTTLGQPALSSNRVNIFDVDMTVNPVSVQEQEAFHAKWILQQFK